MRKVKRIPIGKHLGLMILAHMYGATKDTKPQPSTKQWKPPLTEQELERVRALPKRERKILLEELRAKYRLQRNQECEPLKKD